MFDGLPVSPAVLRHVLFSTVPTATVGLQHDPVLGVGEVDHAPDAVVPWRLVLGSETDDSMLGKQDGDRLLEHRRTHEVVVDHRRQDETQRRHTVHTAPGDRIEAGDQLIQARPLCCELSLDNVTKTGTSDDGGEVDDGQRRPRDRKTVDDDEIVGRGRPAAAMNGDALHTAVESVGSGHIHHRLIDRGVNGVVLESPGGEARQLATGHSGDRVVERRRRVGQFIDDIDSTLSWPQQPGLDTAAAATVLVYSVIASDQSVHQYGFSEAGRRRQAAAPYGYSDHVESQGPAAASVTGEPRAAVVILAGGMGARMKADVNKVYLRIGGRDILEYSVTTALACDLVTDLVLVHRPDDAEHIERLLMAAGTSLGSVVVHTTLGGESRHDSEYAGVTALRSRIGEGLLDVVAVHDAARPFMGDELLRRSLIDATVDGAVIPGLAVTDGLYALDRNRFVDPHDHVWVQTPQTFDAATLLAAHDEAHDAGFQGVDTAEVVQRFSDATVRVIPGHEANIKITYQTDLGTAEGLAADWGARQRR